MPPYIVNDGRIYERVSSGSFPIKDSVKLNHLIMKRRDEDASVARTIEIEPIDSKSKWYPENVCAYIDSGFVLACRDKLNILSKHRNEKILEKVVSVIAKYTNEYKISIVGTRILVTLYYNGAHDQNGNEIAIEGGIQNFIEILSDGSVRFRIIIINTDNPCKASITSIGSLTYIFQEIYFAIVGADFDKNIVYARKYEKLSVLRQFRPYFYLDETNPKNVIKAYGELEESQSVKYGENHIVVGNRFPSDGYLLIDQHLFDEFGLEWNTHTIIKELLSTVFDDLGFVELPVFNNE